jgi:hypothetical protein
MSNQNQQQLTLYSSKPPLEQRQCLEVSSTQGASIELVNIISSAALQYNNIRKLRLDSEPALLFTLNTALEYCAVTYCGASKTTDDTYAECVRFILLKYPFWGVEEIRQAFAHVAATDPNALTSYYGSFSVAMLGSIFQIYTTYRDQVIAALRRLEAQAEAQKKEKSKEEYFQTTEGIKEYREKCQQRIKVLRSMQDADTSNVYLTDYKILTDGALLTLSADEKRTYMGLAETELSRQLLSELTTAPILDRIDIKKTLEILATGGDKSTKDKITILAQKMAVVDWIKSVQKPQTKSQTK